MLRLSSPYPLIVAALLLGASLPAQEMPPLVRPEGGKRKATVTVKTKAKKTEETPAADARTAIDPSLAIVGIVNGHRLTKAQLGYFVNLRMQELGSSTLVDREGGRKLVLNKDMKVDASLSEDPEFKEREQRDREASRRRVESEELDRWVAQRMLADEARRQGVVLATKEFDDRLAQVRQALGMDDVALDIELSRFNLSRSDYEREVYDALLVEKLLERYVDANWSEEQLREIYRRAPHEFHTPPQARFAQFVVALDGSESREMIERRRDLLDEVRKEMRSSKNLAESLAKRTDEADGYFSTADSGWMPLDAETLPPATVKKLLELKPGEVSAVFTDQDTDESDSTYLRSLQVVKLLERRDAPKPSFETARPNLRTRLAAEARKELLIRLREARTHQVITNLKFIPPDVLPTDEELLLRQAGAKPIPLKRPDGWRPSQDES